MVSPDARPQVQPSSQEARPQHEHTRLFEVNPIEAELMVAGATGLREAGLGDFVVSITKFKDVEPGRTIVLYEGQQDLSLLWSVLHTGKQVLEHSGGVEEAKQVVARRVDSEAASKKMWEEQRDLEAKIPLPSGFTY